MDVGVSVGDSVGVTAIGAIGEVGNRYIGLFGCFVGHLNFGVGATTGGVDVGKTEGAKDGNR